MLGSWSPQETELCNTQKPLGQKRRMWEVCREEQIRRGQVKEHRAGKCRQTEIMMTLMTVAICRMTNCKTAPVLFNKLYSNFAALWSQQLYASILGKVVRNIELNVYTEFPAHVPGRRDMHLSRQNSSFSARYGVGKSPLSRVQSDDAAAAPRQHPWQFVILLTSPFSRELTAIWTIKASCACSRRDRLISRQIWSFSARYFPRCRRDTWVFSERNYIKFSLPSPNFKRNIKYNLVLSRLMSPFLRSMSTFSRSWSKQPQ